MAHFETSQVDTGQLVHRYETGWVDMGQLIPTYVRIKWFEQLPTLCTKDTVLFLSTVQADT